LIFEASCIWIKRDISIDGFWSIGTRIPKFRSWVSWFPNTSTIATWNASNNSLTTENSITIVTSVNHFYTHNICIIFGYIVFEDVWSIASNNSIYCPFIFKTAKNYSGNKQVLSTPFHFYFGLRPGSSSYDKFIKYYGPKGAFTSGE